ncbi:MAG: peptide chain release factor N(5)-glutamine methyltransferase [Hyphomicrobiaceae bacterium]
MWGASLGSAIDHWTAAFRGAGIETARLDASLLIGHALGLPRHRLVTDRARRLSEAEDATIAALAGRRLDREPVGRIIGSREFHGLSLALSPETLEPRPDSETLVDTVLDWVKTREGSGIPWQGGAGPSILDLGTGTGCLVLALLAALPKATGLGIDIAQGAVATAARNAAALGLADRARFAIGDYARFPRGTFDIIVSNPPYIPGTVIAGLAPEVRCHDPLLALDGGADGLDAYRAIVPRLNGLLEAGGLAALEVGIGQAGEVAAMLAETAGDSAPREILVRRDACGIERVVGMTAFDALHNQKGVGKPVASR